MPENGNKPAAYEKGTCARARARRAAAHPHSVESQVMVVVSGVLLGLPASTSCGSPKGGVRAEGKRNTSLLLLLSIKRCPTIRSGTRKHVWESENGLEIASKLVFPACQKTEISLRPTKRAVQLRQHATSTPTTPYAKGWTLLGAKAANHLRAAEQVAKRQAPGI